MSRSAKQPHDLYFDSYLRVNDFRRRIVHLLLLNTFTMSVVLCCGVIPLMVILILKLLSYVSSARTTVHFKIPEVGKHVMGKVFFKKIDVVSCGTIDVHIPSLLSVNTTAINHSLWLYTVRLGVFITYGPCGNDPFVCFSTSIPLTLLVSVIGGPGNKPNGKTRRQSV